MDTGDHSPSPQPGPSRPAEVPADTTEPIIPAVQETVEASQLGNYVETSFTNRELVTVIYQVKESERIEVCLQKLAPVTDTSTEDKRSDLRHCVTRFIGKYKNKWMTVHRIKERFEDKNKEWLDSIFTIPRSCSMENSLQEQAISPWDTKSRKSKRREVSEISNIPVKKLVVATMVASHREGDRDLANLLRRATISPGRPGKILETIRKPTRVSRPYTADEALAQILDEGLTRSTYENIRKGNIGHGYNINPPYGQILEAKQRCRPPKESMSISETYALVPLQLLLDHTTARIVTLQEEVIRAAQVASNTTTASATLICTWGFDGSSSQSNYKQRFYGEESDDSSLFATTVVPLRLISTTGQVLWNNRTPQSVRFCRPLRLQFIKESMDVIRDEKHRVESEISQLEELEVEMEEGYSVTVRYQMHLTIIDGKVLQAITNTPSSQSCPICQSLPSSFNKLTTNFQPKDQNLQFGISPLHAWIRLLEFCLHLSYKLEIKSWQARGESMKSKVKEKKALIQKLMREQFGLIVDVPKQVSGTSNDGNTARRAFQNSEDFSTLLGLDREFVEGLHTILIAMSSQFPINPEKFGQFCRRLAERYVSLYPWYYMPVTAHKILIHGEQIIHTSALPLGMMAEDAAESRNKLYRQDRQFHARKTSREATMADVFNRAMDTSDPIVSSMSLVARQTKRRRNSIPEAVISLLEEPLAPVATQLFEEEDEYYDVIEFEFEDLALDREPYEFE